ncbi:MAG: hypothetical protein JWM86_189 [Thermoleophilia bacterium]|nr:hypothetical protein [Thermoleophilia bacterium]
MNDFGQLGNGTSGPTARSIAPVQVLTAAATPLTGVVQVAVGDDTMVARKADGTVWAWGEGGCGDLFSGSFTDSPYAVQMKSAAGVNITTAVDIAAGNRPFVVLSDGRILSSVSTAGSTCSAYPVALTYDTAGTTAITTALDVGASGNNQSVIFARSDGTAWSLGSNYSGKLGQGLNYPATLSTNYFGQMMTGPGTPVTGVVEVAAGGFSGIVRKSDGTAWAAGFDGYGDLSWSFSSADQPYLVRMETSAGVGITGVSHVTGASQTGIHLMRTDNTFWGTGQYEYGQQGETSCCGDPIKQRLTGYLTHDSGGMGTTLLIRSDNQAMGTGVNTRGEAGVCHTRTLMSPVAVSTACGAPYSPWRPRTMLIRDADGSALRCSSVCWLGGLGTSMQVSFIVADQDTADTLTPRYQFAPVSTVMDPLDACTAAGTPLAAQTTTSSNQEMTITRTETGLVNGTSYHARACTVDSGGRTSGWTYDDLWQTAWASIGTKTAFTVDTVAPAPPTSVFDGNPTDIDGQISSTTFVVTYSGGSDAGSGLWGVNYCISASATGADCATTAQRTWTSLAETTGTFTATGLTMTSGTRYYVCVKSEDYAKNRSTAVCSDGSVVDSVAPTNPVPSDGTGADTDLTTSASVLDANWAAGTDTASGVLNYDYCFSASSTGTNCAAGAPKTWTTTAALTGQGTGLSLTHGTRYYSCIRTRDNAGNVATATCSDGAILDVNAPTAANVTPTNGATLQPLAPTLTATYSDVDLDTGTLTFDVCSDAACASVVRSGTTGSLANGANGTYAVTPALAPSTTYWWRARPTDVLTRVGTASTIWSFTTVNAPTIVDNQPGDLTWRNANTGLYDVDFADGVALANYATNVWSAAGQTGTQRQAWTQVATISGTSYTTNWALLASTWTAMAEGVNFVSVRATNSGALTTTSVDTFEVRKDTAAPPTVTTLATGASTVAAPALTWTTVTDATSGVAYYRVFRGTSSTGPWTQVSVDGSPTTGSYSDAAAAVNLTHWYQVQAVDQAGNMAAPSNVVSTYYHRVPTVPTLVSPTNGAVSVVVAPTLSATYADPDGNSGTVSFQVCSDAACGTAVRSGVSGSVSSGSNGTWVVSPALAASTTYWYRAMATDVNGATSGWSGTWSFTTVAAMTVASISPTSGPQGRRGLPFTITGTGFVAGATVTVSGTGVTATVTGVTSTQVTGTLDVIGSAAIGARNVTVTNPDTSSASASGAFTVTTPALTIGLSALGYGDAARNSACPCSLNWGVTTAGLPRQIGPAGSGQTTAGAAVIVSVTSDTTYQLGLQGSVLTSGGNTIAANRQAWKHFGVTEAWTPLSATAQVLETSRPPATTSHSYDLQLDVPAAQTAGTYTGTMSITLVEQP